VQYESGSGNVVEKSCQQNIAKMTIDPKNVSTLEMQNYLQGAVTPRPIALASTIGKSGDINLSPFSYFNCFGARPPILIFSPGRRLRDGTVKHTYENILDIPEVVIHIVNYNMVQQTSLSSTEYPKGINEFIKAGFTEVPSTLVRPPRVAEAPVAMECKVKQIIPTGEEGGAGNLIICEVLLMHIKEEIIGADGKIDPFKLDAVARLGANWYSRVNAPCVFSVPKPVDKKGIGIDSLPEFIRNSSILSGNDLGQLANVTEVPAFDENHEAFQNISFDDISDIKQAFLFAKRFLMQNKVMEAWQILLYKRKDLA
jgi:flavin reductase (DIM6/NTAB) family NADH-FMN oxidoreductase RutF